MSNIPIQNPFSLKGNPITNLDAIYGPYSAEGNTTAKQKALLEIGEDGYDRVVAGLTVGIVENGEIVEYWLQKTNDDNPDIEDSKSQGYNLVKKQASVPDISTNIVSDATSDTKTASPQAVKNYVDGKVSSAYKAAGTASSVSNLGSLDASHEGFVYNMSAAFTTTADFVEGTGKTYPAGTNVAIVNVDTAQSSSYKYDVMAGFVDLNNYVQKSPNAGLLKNDGSVDTVTAGRAESALQPKQSGQYTQGDIVIFDANGGLADSQKKTTYFATAAQGEKADNAIPMPSGTDGQILEKDSNETSGVKWVNKPSDGQDGASAYELYEQAEIAAGRTPLSQEAWLASLKANIGEFKFITPTDTTAEAQLTTIGSTYASTIGGVSPTQSTLSVILLMNDSNNTKTMMIATQDDGNSGFEFVYAGDLQSAMPSNMLTEDDIVNDLNTGGVDNVLSAEQGKKIKEALTEKTDIEFTNKGIVRQTGEISPNTAGYKYSNPIFIKAGWGVNVYSRGGNYSAISTCDSDGTNVFPVITVPGALTERQLFTYTPTQDCYVIVCGQFYIENEYAQAWYIGDISVLKKCDIDDVLDENKTDKVVSNAKVATMNNELQDLNTIVNETLRERVDIEFSNTGIVRYGHPTYQDGEITSTVSSYRYSNPIFIKEGWIVNVYSRGGGFAPICTCDSSGNNRVVVVGKVDDGVYDAQTYTYTATEDCYVVVCGQHSSTFTASAWYLGDIRAYAASGTNEKSLTVKLTMAELGSDGLVYQNRNNAVNEAYSRKTVANVYWVEIGDYANDDKIQCVPFTSINEGETYTIYFFNGSYTLTSSTALTSQTEYKATIPSGTKFVRLAVSSENNLNYSVRYVEVKMITNLLRWHGVRNFLTVSDEITQDGTLKYYRTIFEVNYNGQRLWNVGWLFYSPFYQPVGEKTKLVLLYQGSQGYMFNQDWDKFTDNYHSLVFSLVHSGYNVALCSCLTSLYSTYGDYSGDQLSINAYKSYYNYLIDNFNVEDEPYILGYSNGGMPCGRINVLGDIKAKAIAGGAITTELVGLFRIIGTAVNINKIMHNCGVPDDVNVEHGGRYLSESDFTILKEQGDFLKNYSPMFMSCEGLDWNTYIDTMKNLTFRNMETDEGMIQLFSNVKIQSEIPIKIWIARDDENVSYGLEKFYVEAVNRGGGRAFLRTMPNNAGQHAMGDYGDENSIKIQDFIFKDGTVADTTLFFAEVLDWFEQWK